MENTERHVNFTAPDGAKINGILTLPSGKAKYAVVLLHGITTQKNEYADFFRQFADLLAQHDICSLRIDFRGHGDSTISSRQFSVSSQVLDTLTAAKWLSKTMKLTPVHLIGCSFGSPPAIFASLLNNSLIGRLFLVCPVLDYDATFLNPKTEWAKSLFNPKTLKAAYTNGTLKMTDTFSIDVKLLIEMQFIKPFLALQNIVKKCVIVHGKADSMVPFEITRKRTMGIKNVQVIGIPRMDHGYMDSDDELGVSDASRRNFKKIVMAAVKHIKG